jgi:GrpB-like predicted nucleotidyltransferase (UPF0157 family)
MNRAVAARARIENMANAEETEFLQPRVIHNKAIFLAAPDPSWALAYADAESVIRAALGDRALTVEHVGSTSIPGLVAKPILDILLLVGDSADESAYVPDLEAAGYVLFIREPHWQEHRLLKHSGPDINLHVFKAGAVEAERLLAFRNWLRSHPEERDRYARVKQELAAKEWQYVQDYADAKAEVVEEILARAKSGQ